MKKLHKKFAFVLMLTVLIFMLSACSPEENTQSTPSAGVSAMPSVSASVSPSVFPSAGISVLPSVGGSAVPSTIPSVSPSVVPTTNGTPSTLPSEGGMPSVTPSTTLSEPSVSPSVTPTVIPTVQPTVTPSIPLPTEIFTVNGGTVTGLTAYGKTLSSITVPTMIGTTQITRIGMEAFFDCDALTQVTIPASITHIGQFAFAKCDFLQKVEFATGSSLSYIGDCAFYDCVRLSEIILPDGIQQVDYSAFKKCASLTEIKIPRSVTYIGEYAFKECPALTVYCEVANRPSDWMQKWNAGACPVVWNYKRTSYAVDGTAYAVINGLRFAIKNDTAMLAVQPKNLPQSVVIPSTITYKDEEYPVTKIADFAFAENTYLAEVTIPSSITSVGENAFYRAFALTIYCKAQEKPNGWHEKWNYSDRPVVWDCDNNRVATDGKVYVLHNGLRYRIHDGKATLAVQTKNLVGEIIIPDSLTFGGEVCAVTEICAFAFENCIWLQKLVIPASITRVDNGAFYGCDSLTLYCQFEGKPSSWHTDWNLLKDTLKVPVIWNA